MTIKLRAEIFDPWRELADFQTQAVDIAGKYGATGIFVGTMRDFNQGDEVRGMYLEHYPGMTEKQLQHIVDQAQSQWSLLDVLLIHRIGQVSPNDTLVLVAVWSAHRGDAFDASRFIMENLKSQAPFWKRETLESGQIRWVEKNSDGYLQQP
ncbi:MULTISPECIES: molybdenum cofactor biosynthesis protein MoaE [Methylomonas]|uniref:Molybdopterin synthase catalytic subunit n=2 Tax=Methylomonas TaxID=416 RepID=A0A126T4Y6_9GAMM|nr:MULTISPECIES: molybdenum cofactor biosynthesis protein MoaE [Methylomonas]AMK77151.1 molybdopterin converting factor [Methylomonas denitrificans]OAH97112.1 molybdopterin converting factor [Methylomonas methanica]TCV82662.1 molybdopterin synthase subunit MoaE [Methylomonas methanica]